MDTGEALARSQLARLYRLGVLQQPAGEEENDPHAFLNRLPPPAALEAAPGLQQTSLQTSGELARKHSQLAPYAPVQPYEPLSRIHTRPIESQVTGGLVRVPLSPLSTALDEQQRHTFSARKSLLQTRKDHRDDARVIQQRWFTAWKQRIERKQEFARARVLGQRLVKRRVLGKWHCAVYNRRLTDARWHQLIHWRATRALHSWAAWASLHGRVTRFLAAEGRKVPLFNRLRRDRTWRRWRDFVAWSQHHRKKLHKVTAFRRHHVLRSCWLEWRVVIFHRRRRRVLFRGFLDLIRVEQLQRQKRCELAAELHGHHVRERLRRLLRRWRLFNDARQREHLQSWRVRMVLSRGKYFTLWNATLHHGRRIVVLQARVAQRIQREHLRAWSVAVRAVDLGRTSTLWHPEAILTRYLGVWKLWASESTRFRKATNENHLRQRRRALRAIRDWTVEHSRMTQLFRTADGIARRRILLRVWTDGLLAYHLQRQQEMALAKRVQAITFGKVLATWRLVWCFRHEWRAKKLRAQQMQFRSAIIGVWTAWRRHTAWRRLHKYQIVQATRHHLHHHLLSGLLALSLAVDRKCVQNSAARHIRVRHRCFLKRLVFTEWRNYVRRHYELDGKVTYFSTRLTYSRSVWNPMWRWWTRWRRFVFINFEMERMYFNRLRFIIHQFLQAWRRRVFVVSRAHARRQTLCTRMQAAAFDWWRCYASKRREKHDLRLRAHHFHCKRSESSALSSWHTFARSRSLQRRRLEQIYTLHDRRLVEGYYWRWATRFRQISGLRRLEASRQRSWQRFCWDVWHEEHTRISKRKMKLHYYRQVFGLYPSTSPLHRFWLRWKRLVLLRGSAHHLQRRSEQRLLRCCFVAWRTFCMAKKILKKWHTFSVIAAATNNDLGKRIRFFHRRRTLRLTASTFSTWTSATKSRQHQQERIALSRRSILAEIQTAEATRSKYRRSSVRLWFNRWRRRQLSDLFSAECWYRNRVCSRIFQNWWRQVVHRKQERLLEDARRSVQNMSINRIAGSSRQLPTTLGTTRSNAAKLSQRVRLPCNEKPLFDLPSATGRGRRSERMVDPDMQTSSYLHRSSKVMARHHVDPNPVTRGAQKLSRAVPRQNTSQRTLRGDFKAVTSVMQIQQHQNQSRREPPTQVEELPLYDDEPKSPQARIGAPSFPKFPLRLNSEDNGPLLSLESIASMDPYSPTRPPAQEPRHPLVTKTTSVVAPAPPTACILRESNRGNCVRDRTLPSAPVLYTADQSLRPHQTEGKMSTRTTKPVIRTKPLQASEELADILDIARHQEVQANSIFRSVLDDMKTGIGDQTSEVDPDEVMTSIVTYYAQKRDTMSEPSNLNGWLEARGFCMLRDLGLFETGCFITAMERAIQRVPSGIQEPRTQLNELLQQFILTHPSYLSTAKRQSKVDPSSWLVNTHLRLRFGKTALHSSANRPFWIRAELPKEVIVSLPKLLKCFRKYQKQLQQFFSWRPENTASIRGGIMDRTMFLLLMKHCNIHPQLFDRRELDTAFDASGSRHSHTGAEILLSFPQFLEVLVRCALRLQWCDEPSHSRDAELVIVIKFLMLVFAMEGRGSMLTKRTQDLDVIMGFLQRQQSHAKTAKLKKFQGLLRSESLRRKPKTSGHQSAFQRAMEAREMESSRPVNEGGHRQHGEQGAAPLLRRDCCVPSHEQNIPSNLGVVDHTHASRDWIEASSQSRNQGESGQHLSCHSPNELELYSDPHGIQAPDKEEVTPVHQVGKPTERSVQAHGISKRCEAPLPSEVPLDVNGSKAVENPFLSLVDESGLQLPIDRDAFLNDILSSISDVEFLLQQSDIRRPSQLQQDSTEPDAQLTSEPFSAAYPSRYVVLVNGQLPPSEEDDFDAGRPAEDIKVSDPLLDHLTFAERFSEPPDWQSSVSIADLAAYGIHSAFPSSLHVVGQLETGELEDLTDPQRTQSLLRANEEDDISSLWNE